MRRLVTLYLTSLKLFEKIKITTFYQVRNGNHTEWMPADKWRQKLKENELNKILLGGAFYASTKLNQPESFTVLPLPNIPRTKEYQRKDREN